MLIPTVIEKNNNVKIYIFGSRARGDNELKSDISLLGMVNIGAIEEYERVKTRYEFLNNQKNDLFTCLLLLLLLY